MFQTEQNYSGLSCPLCQNSARPALVKRKYTKHQKYNFQHIKHKAAICKGNNALPRWLCMSMRQISFCTSAGQMGNSGHQLDRWIGKQQEESTLLIHLHALQCLPCIRPHNSHLHCLEEQCPAAKALQLAISYSNGIYIKMIYSMYFRPFNFQTQFFPIN